ncbi:44747_t:CDS:1, partial [Gigaspora margarita]
KGLKCIITGGRQPAITCVWSGLRLIDHKPGKIGLLLRPDQTSLL